MFVGQSGEVNIKYDASAYMPAMQEGYGPPLAPSVAARVCGILGLDLSLSLSGVQVSFSRLPYRA